MLGAISNTTRNFVEMRLNYPSPALIKAKKLLIYGKSTEEDGVLKKERHRAWAYSQEFLAHITIRLSEK